MEGKFFHVDVSSRVCTVSHKSTWTAQPLRQGCHPPGSQLPLPIDCTSIFIEEASSPFKLMLSGFTYIYLNLLLSSSNLQMISQYEDIVIWPHSLHPHPSNNLSYNPLIQLTSSIPKTFTSTHLQSVLPKSDHRFSQPLELIHLQNLKLWLQSTILTLLSH